MTVTSGLVAEPAAPSFVRPVIRRLTTVDAFESCVALQREVWGWSDLDLMPVRVFVLLHEAGGVVLGAYADDALVGFVNAVPGARDGAVFWHSHMMAVRTAFQGRGIGTALKHAQRQLAEEAGVPMIQWVFDPLQARTADFNLGKLGVVVRRYSINHYGPSSSPMHAGLERDLLVAEWWLQPPPFGIGGETRTIAIPTDFQRVRRATPSMARPIQAAVRAAFLGLLDGRFVAVGFERGPERSCYVLRRRLDRRASEQ